MRSCASFLALLFTAVASAQTPGDNDFAADEAVLKGYGLPAKGEPLLNLLRERTPSAEITAEFQAHVKRLKSPAFLERSQATERLLKLGPVVRPLLESLLIEANFDLETMRRLRHVLEYFPAEKDLAIVASASRLIARDKPEGSLPVLLDFVPHVTHEYVRQEVQRTINVIAALDKKPSPLLLESLKDANPGRRAAAAEALVRAFGDGVKDEIAPLMKDTNSLVRYQLGAALVESGDKAGLPLLIAALADGPPERADFTLDLLYRVAGDNAPSEYYPGKAKAPQYAAKWQGWLDKHGAKLDLKKSATQPYLGFTVITTTAIGAKGQNKIFELAADKSVRWEFAGPRYPVDIHILGPNRLLMAEYTDRRVTERNFKGEILWQVQVASYPLSCQRLPNGHTFIATRQQLLIVDRDGKDVFNHFFQGINGSIASATRLRNGQFVVVTSGGRCSLLDQKGAELKTIALGGNVYPTGGGIEVLPNGRILAPIYTRNAVVEFDWNGNQLWSANVTGTPVFATRLSNGHTLVACLNYRIVELDQNGKEVWSFQTEGRPFRARRR